MWRRETVLGICDGEPPPQRRQWPRCAAEPGRAGRRPAAVGGDAPCAPTPGGQRGGPEPGDVLCRDAEGIRSHILPRDPLPVALVSVPTCALGGAVFLAGDEFLCKVIALLGSGFEDWFFRGIIPDCVITLSSDCTPPPLPVGTLPKRELWSAPDEKFHGDCT